MKVDNYERLISIKTSKWSPIFHNGHDFHGFKKGRRIINFIHKREKNEGNLLIIPRFFILEA